jgi:hypothetical protein
MSGANRQHTVGQFESDIERRRCPADGAQDMPFKLCRCGFALMALLAVVVIMVALIVPLLDAAQRVQERSRA